MMHRKTQIAAAVGAALFAVGTAAFGQAGPTVQAYGQISRTLLHADDGVQNKWFHTDNESSGTRFGLTGSAPAPWAGNRVGFRIELDLQSNESQLVNFSPAGPVSNFSGTASGAGFNERHMDAWMEGSWGRFNIGQGDGAANGASESDLSGTGMVNGIGVADLAGGFQYRNATGYSGTTIGQSINQQDFESRYDRVQYTTPSFNGFRASVSTGTVGGSNGAPNLAAAPGGTANEGSVWYSGKIGNLGELAGALGFSSRGGQAAGLRKQETMGGSVSWLHGSGINVTLGMTQRDLSNAGTVADPNREAEFTYVKVGYKWGQHAIAGDYATSKNQGLTGANNGPEAATKGKMMGIAYVWAPVAWADLYVSYKIHELDSTTGAGVSTNWDDISILTTGVRVKF